MRAQPCRLKHRAHESNRGTFAVRARDVNNRRQAVMRIAQGSEQPFHPFQPQRNGLVRQGYKFLQFRFDIRHGWAIARKRVI